MTKTFYGEITGLVCVRYWLDAWDEGWHGGYPKVKNCWALGFLSCDYGQAKVNAWESEVVEDVEIWNDSKRGYYAVLPPFFKSYIMAKDPMAIVEATGRIDIHEGGAIRAEKMQILHLFMPSSCDANYLSEIRKRYDVHNTVVDKTFKAVDAWLSKNNWVETHNNQLLNP